MNSALRISVVIAWLMVTITVKPSDAGAMCSLAPLLANAIDQLSIGSVNEITPHVEALANIVKGNDLYSLFHHVEEECHKHKNQLENKEQSSVPKGTNDGNIEKSLAEKGTSEAENDASKKVDAQSETEASTKEASDSEGSESDNEETPGGKKVPSPKRRYALKDIPNQRKKTTTMNEKNVELYKDGNKLTVKLKKKGDTQWTESEYDISGQVGDQLVRSFLQKLTSA